MEENNAFSLIDIFTNIIWRFPRVMKVWAWINIAIFAPIDVYAFLWLPGHTFYQPVLEVQLGMLILGVSRLKINLTHRQVQPAAGNHVVDKQQREQAQDHEHNRLDRFGNCHPIDTPPYEAEGGQQD